MSARWTVLALTAVLAGAAPALAGPMATSPQPLPAAAVAAGLALRSPDFAPGGAIALGCVYDESGCRGGNTSPALAWKHPPAGTRSFAVLLFDPDARGGWWHWAVFDIPVGVASLRAGAGDPGRHLLPLGAIQARNDWGSLGYGGPCPPPGPPHHYRLMIYALRIAKLGLDSSASAAQVAGRVQANALAQAQVVGLYSR
ncbi:MAG: YbhB/YbcL family Raf kinase inhibitor-like protein [Steroidobacteraceae bacterium]